ncbi:hypothetical protein AJ87_49270 [Rhizobium yanglingense]|nr:hypothetical protein AJ87_49270 [Rhizobium yanglingense]
MIDAPEDRTTSHAGFRQPAFQSCCARNAASTSAATPSVESPARLSGSQRWWATNFSRSPSGAGQGGGGPGGKLAPGLEVAEIGCKSPQRVAAHPFLGELQRCDVVVRQQFGELLTVLEGQDGASVSSCSPRDADCRDEGSVLMLERTTIATPWLRPPFSGQPLPRASCRISQARRSWHRIRTPRAEA